MIPDKTLEDLGWAQLLEAIASRAHTERGSEAAGELVFFDHASDAAERMAEVSEARRLEAVNAPMPFGGISDVRDAVSRARKGGGLDGEALVEIGRAARGVHQLAKHLDRHAADVPLLASRCAVIADLSRVHGPILESFEPDGRLADHASEALGGLRRQVSTLHAKLERKAQTLVDDPKLAKHLQDSYFTLRDDRYVVPVRVESRARVRGIVHGTSQSGQTLFIEPDAIVEVNNSLRLAECEVADEERRILGQLTSYVARDAEALLLALQVATALDLIDACARLARDIEAVPLEIDSDGRATLHQARHPLMVLSGKPCVPNDLMLAARSVLVISGPNAGGKTVALKTLGLVALMVRAGLHAPVGPGSHMPWLSSVLCDIGDSQSIEKDLSTFSAHLLALREFLSVATSDTLVLIDEIAVGTEPEQGAALARAVLEELASRGAPSIVTTHYESLKTLASSDSRFENASVGFDMERMEPTFRLHLGTPGSSGALRVGRRLGLPDTVLDRAETLLGEGQAGIEELLASLGQARRELEDERAAAEATRDEAERKIQAAESARIAADERRRKLHEGLYDEGLTALKEARRELDELRTRAKRRRVTTGEPAKLERARVGELAKELAKNAPARPEPPGRAVSSEELQIGDRVYVASLGGQGEVVSAPERGKVQVAVGIMRTLAPISDLRILPGRGSKRRVASPSPKKAKKAKAKSQSVRAEGAVEAAAEDPAYLRTPEVTVDVRGERAHEAVARVDKFIDDTLREERECVFVIHGRGTGALRQAVRELLAEHYAVTKFRSGLPNEGGDGVTVAWLDS